MISFYSLKIGPHVAGLVGYLVAKGGNASLAEISSLLKYHSHSLSSVFGNSPNELVYVFWRPLLGICNIF